MHPRHRRAGFVFCIVLAGSLAVVLSFYKIAIANAYRTFPDLPDVSERYLGDTALMGPISEHKKARGAWLVDVIGCRDCHGAQLQGAALEGDDAAEWLLSAPALTGPGGRAAHFTGDDWRRALRLGVDGERRGLWGMPRRALLALRDQDVAAIAGAIRSAPAPDEPLPTLPHSRLWPRGYAAVALRTLWPLDRDSPAEAALRADWQASVPTGNDAALGDYLASVAHCQHCHRHDNARRVSSVWRARRGPPLPVVVGAADETAGHRQARWQAAQCKTRAATDVHGPPTLSRERLFSAPQQDALFAALSRALPAQP